MFSGKEEDFYVWAKKVENYVSGVFPTVRGALLFGQDWRLPVCSLGMLGCAREHPCDVRVTKKAIDRK